MRVVLTGVRIRFNNFSCKSKFFYAGLFRGQIIETAVTHRLELLIVRTSAGERPDNGLEIGDVSVMSNLALVRRVWLFLMLTPLPGR